MANRTVDNPIANIFQFYSDLAEQSAPVIKQGIEDYFTVYSKLWTEGLKMQNDWIRQFTGNKENSDFTDQMKDSVEKAIETQKNITTDLVDTTLKGVRSIKTVTDKTKN